MQPRNQDPNQTQGDSGMRQDQSDRSRDPREQGTGAQNDPNRQGGAAQSDADRQSDLRKPGSQSEERPENRTDDSDR